MRKSVLHSKSLGFTQPFYHRLFCDVSRAWLPISEISLLHSSLLLSGSGQALQLASPALPTPTRLLKNLGASMGGICVSSHLLYPKTSKEGSTWRHLISAAILLALPRHWVLMLPAFQEHLVQQLHNCAWCSCHLLVLSNCSTNHLLDGSQVLIFFQGTRVSIKETAIPTMSGTLYFRGRAQWRAFSQSLACRWELWCLFRWWAVEGARSMVIQTPESLLLPSAQSDSAFLHVLFLKLTLKYHLTE